MKELSQGVWAIVDKEVKIKMIGVTDSFWEDWCPETDLRGLAIFWNIIFRGEFVTETVTCLSNLALTAMGMDRIILIAILENKASIH